MSFFIYKNYKEHLSDQSLTLLVDSLEHKGIEYMDYLLTTQGDSLIDKDVLETYDDLGLEDDNIDSDRQE
ncbi:hypothetical protein ACDX78_17375 [Virgibacillus oceani]